MKNKSKTIGELDLILKPSKIQGVGVFANRNIIKGEKLLLDKKIRKIKISTAKKNKQLYQMCENYCAETKNYYACPINFGAMSVLWYLNHSKKPNLKAIKNGWITKNTIKKGQELTIDYSELDKDVDNAYYFNKKLK